MNIAHWAIVIGLLLTTLAIASSWVERLPLSMAMLYMVVGCAIGPQAWRLLDVELPRDAGVIEHIAAVALLVSLFSAGMKLGVPLLDRRWLLPFRLATGGMVVTTLLTTLLAIWCLHLPYATALLLGAILAPTDPVLAAGVQVSDRTDRDRLRFSLTGEGGLNDATALPFLILALDLLDARPGDLWLRWLLVDVGWSLVAGLVIGGLLGKCIGALVVHLRVTQQEAIGLDEFLALGLIGLSYGIAEISHASGFLAVFAAGIMLQHTRREPGADTLVQFLEGETRGGDAAKKLATHPDHAGTFMMKAVRGFNEQLEHVGEVAIVLVVGGLLAYVSARIEVLLFVALLFFCVRPLSIWLSLRGAPVARDQRLLISWFGIRGIGSIYYLMVAIGHGLPPETERILVGAVLAAVTCSIIIHGISVTPLMRFYRDQHARWRNRDRR